MPCICHGAVSGKEEFDSFLMTNEGKEIFKQVKDLADKIKNVDIHVECMPVEFRQMWAKCFLHMLVGCDEQVRPQL